MEFKQCLNLFLLFTAFIHICCGDNFLGIKKAINDAAAEVNNRRNVRHPPLGGADPNGPDSPVASRAVLQKRREGPTVIETLGHAADIIVTATDLFAKRNGKFPNPEVFRKVIAPYCPKQIVTCKMKNRYRTADGACNNMKHPQWGASITPQPRFLPPDYSDPFGIGTVPRIKSVTGKLLPNARLISNALSSGLQSSTKDPVYNIGLLHFGILMTFDIVSTPLLQDGRDNIVCCHGDKPVKRSECFPFFTPPGDFKMTCQPLVRSEIAPEPNCFPGPRHQMNQKTSYLDLSSIYGNTPEGQKRIRQYGTGHADNFDQLFTPLHVVFLREQNNIYMNLKELGWKGKSLFEETRKIIIGIYQHIVYTEYLPAILGREGMVKYGLNSRKYGYNTQYDPNVDASTRNAFAAAAYRFGHSTINNLENDLFGIFSPDTVQDYMKMVSNPPVSQQITLRFQGKSDRFLSGYARNQLYETMPGNGFDLFASNIQRGRDHGLPSYNHWRKFCGLRPIMYYKSGEMGFIDHDPITAKLLASVYRHPDDIDLFVGGLSERPAPGAIVGPTFRCIIGLQFSAYKRGDRFFYENDFHSTGFTKGQLDEIKRQSLGSLFCRNIKIGALPRNIFVSPKTGEPLIPCKAFPSLNLQKWRIRYNTPHAY